MAPPGKRFLSENDAEPVRFVVTRLNRPVGQTFFPIGSVGQRAYFRERWSHHGNRCIGLRRSAATIGKANLMSGLFYNLGRRLGHVTVPAIRKSKWIWDGLTGSEEDALRAETGLGSALAAELRGATEPVHDPEMARQIRDLCRRLAVCVREKRRGFLCEVIHDETPNAMALPGGFIFISDSLVRLCERQPDEVAFVLGHEMAHVILRHAWDRMVNQATLRVASAIAARSGPLGGWLRQNGLVLLQSAHSQDGEFEADEFGVHLATTAGFAPQAALTMLERVAAFGPDASGLGQYFSSHPPASKRIAKLTPLCRQLAAPRLPAKNSNVEGTEHE